MIPIFQRKTADASCFVLYLDDSNYVVEVCRRLRPACVPRRLFKKKKGRLIQRQCILQYTQPPTIQLSFNLKTQQKQKLNFEDAD